ncbi:DUF1761 domain-containing protein [Marinobacter sp.]|uniref:DUF1761 domain-containing protein n=1 Tax=Marinobacter sp. TaxID=50741 RepID=UPI0035C760EB
MSIVGVLVATVIGMVLGALWYSPALFGEQWMRSLGKSRETLGSPTWPMIGSILASLLSALGVALLHAWIGVDSLGLALGIGVTLGLLIIFPAFLSDNLFCGWGWPLLWIQSGYRIVSVLLMSVAIYLVDG